jgi:ABC-2 type transport system permease protein
MRAALTAELRKLTSTRLWWILLLLMAGYLAFLAAVIAFSVNAEAGAAGAAPGVPAASGADAAEVVYSLINAIGYVFPLVIGSLTMTTEFRHGTITQSLLVEPRRTVLLAAKLVVGLLLGAVYGVVAALAVVAGGAPVLAAVGDGAFLGDGAVLQVLLYGVLVTALWAVIGVAFGSVATNQVAAIIVIIAFTQLVEPIARVGLGSVDALAGVASYLPGAAADAVMGASFFADLGGGDLLPRWAGLLVLLAYAVVLAVVGRLTTLRRDLG